MAELDHTSLCNHYSNFTFESTNLAIGVDHPLAVTIADGFDDQEQCGVWIDWNQDEDFDDLDEAIAVDGSPGTGPFSAVVTPPAHALPGLTRMRIRLTWTGDVLPCGDTEYGPACINVNGDYIADGDPIEQRNGVE